jgi:hypothetical protein
MTEVEVQAIVEGDTPDRGRELPVPGVLPVTTKFELGDTITPDHRRFLDTYGFLHFKGVATPEEVETLRAEQDRIQAEWFAEGRKSVYGIPLFWGKGGDGKPAVQRMPFTSVFSPFIRDFVRDERFLPIQGLVGKDVRVGDEEKDGVVMNRYVNVPGSVYPRLGWHTDGLRDLFYLRMPQQMLNFGLHLDRITEEDGGLRLIPGTHKQGFFSMFFRKPHFVYHRRDKKELMVETDPGDLTVHDGRLWHRVGLSTKTGMDSLRRSMYVPYMTGPFEPKSPDSKTPLYHRWARWLRRLKGGR